MIKELTKGLRVKVDPKGWLGSPSVHIFDGACLVLTAYVDTEGGLRGWTTAWGLYGPEPSREAFKQDMFCALMGWSKAPRVKTLRDTLQAIVDEFDQVYDGQGLAADLAESLNAAREALGRAKA